MSSKARPIACEFVLGPPENIVVKRTRRILQQPSSALASSFLLKSAAQLLDKPTDEQSDCDHSLLLCPFRPYTAER